jgi:archaellum biogenesis protein FlaJ (TadC family)
MQRFEEQTIRAYELIGLASVLQQPPEAMVHKVEENFILLVKSLTKTKDKRNHGSLLVQAMKTIGDWPEGGQ